MSLEALGLVALITLLVLIFVGFPISFTLITLGVVFGYIGIGQRVFDLMILQFYGIMKDPLMAAIPLFVFMGLILENTGLMNRLFHSFQLLLGRVRGSLYIIVCVTSIILAASTGIVGASVTLLGVMAGPSMKKAGYDTRLSAGIITAGGTLGILIPPSIMLVVLGPIAGVPVIDLFAAAIIPGLVLAALFLIYALVRCWLRPSLGPPLLSAGEKKVGFKVLLRELMIGLIPAVGIVSASLGSILFGIATPTEGAGIGAFGAVVLAVCFRELSWKKLVDAIFGTLTISSMILFLVAASNFFGAVFSYLGTPDIFTKWLVQFNLPPLLMLIAILALIFLLGWPLEWVPIVLIVLPVFLPIIRELGINITWFCILVAVILQTAWLSPPVALSAYYLKGVMPEWDLKDIYSGMFQYMVLQLIGFILILIFPQLVLWLPSVLLG